ncbi:MAG TPA: glycoside hydrolase family 15 protein [Acidimicrobiia bacterium]|nr:glycoside hydrolase family 15 protein [Acidimicrobiia bacterium]
MAYQPIENYGVIGDLQTVALVGMNGSIDFCSFPTFDSPTIFAALLDHERGGHFSIHPARSDVTYKQMYLPDTNVLISRFLTGDGLSEVSDFMPVGIYPHDHPRVLVRRAKCVRRSVRFDLVFDPRFDYGRADRTVEVRDGEVVYASTGGDGTALRLRTPVPLTVDRHGVARASFELQAGDTAIFVMEEVAEGTMSWFADPDHGPEAFKATVNFWRSWIGHSAYTGRWREIVNRSALVLKLLVSQTHGSLVAAPTFGLPEEIGGERNWDYRYTWIRDASFTVFALIRLGYTEEAGAFMRWIHDRCMDLNPDGSLQIMYGLDGRKILTEEVLPHLEGYRGSAPVRIGNGAYNQLQLDIYGELMDAVYLYNKYGELVPYELWNNLVRLVDWVCDHWQLPDAGIWEVRGGHQEFLYSRLMCWVAVDRGIRLADRRSFPYPFSRWRGVRDALYHEIMTSYWNPRRRTFIQCLGTDTVDASTLLMPLVKFISPTDPRFLDTLAVVREDIVDDSLVYRYKIGAAARDGLKGEEGTFNMCSFWLAEATARAGDVQRGRFLFDKTLGYANHLGLFAEELGPQGEHLGNFPQAFTHLGLISAAYSINRKLSDAGWVG